MHKPFVYMTYFILGCYRVELMHMALSTWFSTIAMHVSEVDNQLFLSFLLSFF